MPAPYSEALERALGRVVRDQRDEAARQLELLSARADAAVARIEARGAELEIRLSGLDADLDRRVAAGIEAGLAAIEDRLRTTLRPDDAPLVALAARVDALENRSTEALETRMAAVEAQGAAIMEWQEGLELPEVPDIEPLAARVSALEQADPPAPPDLTGLATKEDIEAVRAAIPAVPEPRDWTPEIDQSAAAFTAELEATEARIGALAASLTENMTERLARHPGVFPQVCGWTDRVHRAGDVVTHDGAAWQAQRDTGKAPPHDDWTCIAARGGKGADGRSFTVRGTHDDAETYAALDVAVKDGSAFVARQDDPGACPGDGWQLIASRGGRGKAGADAKPVKGAPGEPVVSMDVDGDGLLTLTNGDGSTVTLDLYPLLAKVR